MFFLLTIVILINSLNFFSKADNAFIDEFRMISTLFLSISESKSIYELEINNEEFQISDYCF